jgi:hypothetical protein
MSKRATNNVLAVIIIATGVILGDTSQLSLPALSLPTLRNDSPSLTDFGSRVRESMPDRGKARQLGLVAGEFARQVEFDGSLPEPRVTDTAVAIGFLKDMNGYAFQGEVLATEGYRTVVKAEFDRRFQADGKGKDLGPDVRQQLVTFFREIQHALE